MASAAALSRLASAAAIDFASPPPLLGPPLGKSPLRFEKIEAIAAFACLGASAAAALTSPPPPVLPSPLGKRSLTEDAAEVIAVFAFLSASAAAALIPVLPPVLLSHTTAAATARSGTSPLTSV